jgi:hypothetical protein
MKSANVHDIDGDGRPDLLVSFSGYDCFPVKQTLYYKNNFLTSIENQTALPLLFKLKQNFPNPFNNTTKISFSLNTNSKIDLIVYDQNGKEVIRLIKGLIYPPGEYQISWDGLDYNGKEVSSGIYFIRLSSQYHGQVIKSILLK